MTQSVGAGGGSLVSKDGTLTITIPPGALGSMRTITLDERPLADAGAPFNGRNVARVFELGPSGTVFEEPVAVTIRTAQQVTRTEDGVSVATQLLMTTENGAAVPLLNQVMDATGDVVSVTGEMTHFSTLVLEGSTHRVSATFSNVPDEANVGIPVEIEMRVVPEGTFLWTLLGVTYHDQSELFVPNPPIPLITPFTSVDNRVLESLPYECTSVGAGLFNPEVVVHLSGPEFSDREGQHYSVRMESDGLDVKCEPQVSDLRVEFRGDGGGTVAGGPSPAFTCVASCTQEMLASSNAELTATPNTDSRFAGFSGQCGNSDVAGVAEPFSMVADRLCIVTFLKKPVHTVSISRSGLGSGSVTINGEECADDCAVQVPDGTPVELRATPATGSRFAFWGPSCPTPTPNAPIIVFTPDGPVSCQATFPLEQLNVTIAPAEAVLDIGTVQRLNVVITDETGTLDRDVTFTSGAPSVASVDAEGNVTALAPGTAAIAASVAGPGGGLVYSFITVRQTLFGLTVRKTGSGTGTTSIYDTGNGESTNFCDVDCPGLTARLPQGSVLNVFASPSPGSTLVRFLDDCSADPAHPGVGVVNLTEAKTCTVEFGTSGPLSIAFGGLTSKSTGLPVSIGSVSGDVYAEYETQNLPGDWGTLNVGTSIDGVPMGPCLPPSVGGRVRCEVNTAGLDSLVPIRGLRTARIRNGLRSLSFSAKRPEGTEIATVLQDITLANQNQLRLTTNNPPGSTSSTVRGGLIEVRIALDLFDDINGDNLQVLLNPGPPPVGSGPLLFNGGPSDDPFLFSADPGTSPNAQGPFTATPVVLDGNGNDITDFFNPPPGPWQQNIDMVPPDVPSFFMPPSTPISRGVLILDFQTGPYPAGTSIPLDRISGGSIVGAHLPFCGSAHYHGTISIRQENSPAFDGPFADPRNGANCGHGIIGTENLENAFFSFGGSVTDASPIATRVEMLQGLNGCDDVDLFDDIPFPVGNGPGQSPNPFFESTSNPFTAMFDLNLGPSMAGQDVCFRIVVFDSAVGPDGLPVNGVTRVLETQLDPFIPPPPQ